VSIAIGMVLTCLVGMELLSLWLSVIQGMCPGLYDHLSSFWAVVPAFLLVPPVFSLWPPLIHSPSAFSPSVLPFLSPSCLVVCMIDKIVIAYVDSVVHRFTFLYVVSVVTFMVVVVGVHVLGFVLIVAGFTVGVMVLM
jgi:hypothetical protein